MTSCSRECNLMHLLVEWSNLLTKSQYFRYFWRLELNLDVWWWLRVTISTTTTCLHFLCLHWPYFACLTYNLFLLQSFLDTIDNQISPPKSWHALGGYVESDMKKKKHDKAQPWTLSVTLPDFNLSVNNTDDLQQLMSLHSAALCSVRPTFQCCREVMGCSGLVGSVSSSCWVTWLLEQLNCGARPETGQQEGEAMGQWGEAQAKMLSGCRSTWEIRATPSPWLPGPSSVSWTERLLFVFMVKKWQLGQGNSRHSSMLKEVLNWFVKVAILTIWASQWSLLEKLFIHICLICLKKKKKNPKMFSCISANISFTVGDRETKHLFIESSISLVTSVTSTTKSKMFQSHVTPTAAFIF